MEQRCKLCYCHMTPLSLCGQTGHADGPNTLTARERDAAAPTPAMKVGGLNLLLTNQADDLLNWASVGRNK